jgi:hypothetical protein
MGADGRNRGAHGRARRRRGAAGHGDGVLRARQGARDGAHRARCDPPRDRRARLRHAGAHHRGRDRRPAGGGDALLPGGRHPRCASGRRGALAHPRREHRARACPDANAPSRSCSSPSLATCEPGDEVVYPDPGFPIYESAIRWVGATPVPLPLREELEFSFAVRELQARLSERTKLVILNSPQNPTGGVTPAADPAAAAELILATPAWVLTDEVYARLIGGDAFARLRACPGCSSAPCCWMASRRPTR